ncbi:MAG: carbon-nitrogen hydrolase family protein [Clostridia bacterium]|nr:carbon-nitrogen hydrolase family protein [Clostridia bacterium]
MPKYLHADNNLFLNTDIKVSSYSPHGTKVIFSQGEEGYCIRTEKGAFSLGKWLLECAVSGGEVYDLSLLCKTALSEEDVYVIVTQYTECGKMPIREHAHIAVREGGNICFSDKVETAQGTVRLSVELWLKGDGAEAVWHDIFLTRGNPVPERRVRIAPVHTRVVGESIDRQRENILQALDRAGDENADIVILGEALYGRGLGLSLPLRAENENGAMSLAIREKAKQHHMYIVYNTVEADAGAYYNTSYLFGREGEVVGKYRKTHLPVTELEEGLSPGRGYPVFDLDFGKVGLLICYDQFFPRTAEALAMAGAELLCISSIGDMSHCSFARAMENGVYVAISGANHENPHGFGATRVIDPLGTILAQTDENFDIALCEVDLSRRVRRYWMSTGPALSDVHDDYRFEKNSHSFR